MKLGRFLAGIASGLTFGVLFAPKKGKHLRKEVLQGKGDLKALGRAFKGAGEEAWEEIKKLSKHEQVEAFLQLSEERLKEIASNLEGESGETLQKAKVQMEKISAFALEKASVLKAVLQEEAKKVKVNSSSPKKKTVSPKKKVLRKKQTVRPPKNASTKKPSPASKKTK